jgi:hypothetical protein
MYRYMDKEEISCINSAHISMAKQALNDTDPDFCLNWEGMPHFFICRPMMNQVIDFVNDSLIKSVVKQFKLDNSEWNGFFRVKHCYGIGAVILLASREVENRIQLC